MNPHLSALEISECVIGGASPFVEQHARECARCQTELASLGDSLSRFRGAVQGWSNDVDRAEFKVILRTTPARPRFGSPQFAGASSLAVHAVLLAGIFVLGTFHPVQSLIKRQITALEVDLRPYLTQQNTAASGGGGGGARTPLSASKGKLPKSTLKQFTPPQVDPPPDPKLPMAPSIIAPDDIPNIQATHYGDPLSRLNISSNGIGNEGGMGGGDGRGVGWGKGPGAGPGLNGGFSGNVYRIGGGVSAPRVLSKVEPEYSEEARKAKWQGTVVLSLVVDDDGRPQNLKVLRSLGLGLDQKAIEAVSHWRFRPGLKEGKAVPVYATIEVNFRLL